MSLPPLKSSEKMYEGFLGILLPKLRTTEEPLADVISTVQRVWHEYQPPSLEIERWYRCARANREYSSKQIIADPALYPTDEVASSSKVGIEPSEESRKRKTPDQVVSSSVIIQTSPSSPIGTIADLADILTTLNRPDAKPAMPVSKRPRRGSIVPELQSIADFFDGKMTSFVHVEDKKLLNSFKNVSESEPRDLTPKNQHTLGVLVTDEEEVLCAKEFIPAETYLGEGGGELIETPEELDTTDYYPLSTRKNRIISTANYWNEFNLMGYATSREEANVDSVEYYDRDPETGKKRPHVLFYALRDIQPGERLSAYWGPF